MKTYINDLVAFIDGETVIIQFSAMLKSNEEYDPVKLRTFRYY